MNKLLEIGETGRIQTRKKKLRQTRTDANAKRTLTNEFVFGICCDSPGTHRFLNIQTENIKTHIQRRKTNESVEKKMSSTK